MSNEKTALWDGGARGGAPAAHLGGGGVEKLRNRVFWKVLYCVKFSNMIKALRTPKRKHE